MRNRERSLKHFFFFAWNPEFTFSFYLLVQVSGAHRISAALLPALTFGSVCALELRFSAQPKTHGMFHSLFTRSIDLAVDGFHVLRSDFPEPERECCVLTCLKNHTERENEPESHDRINTVKYLKECYRLPLIFANVISAHASMFHSKHDPFFFNWDSETLNPSSGLPPSTPRGYKWNKA